MKSPAPLLLLALSALILTSCASSASRKQPAPAAVSGTAATHSSTGKPAKKSDGKTVKVADDELDEYAVATVADPLEPLNRVTFTVNHQIYTFILKPVSKGYEKVVPKPARQGIHNAFENVKFPIRFVNDTLQGNFKRAGLETGKFVVNTVVGVGGLGRPSDHIPALAEIPAADTGQTLAKWGIGNGIYIVLPVLGPSTLRDTVGLAGDYALNPITWVSIVFGGYAWIVAIPTTNTVRGLPNQLSQYDAATKDALDRYLAARSAYIQYRKEAAAR